MIIECPACGTKYRFDESLITEEGAWLRCSRCQYVFYREPLAPSAEEEISPLPPKKPFRWWWIAVPVLAIIVILGIFFALYLPEDKIAQYIPFANKPSPTSPTLSVPAQVKLIDLRQYFIENPILGKIRVVQGSALNTSAKSITRIKIKGELYDVLGVKVLESYAYCGNILTNQELSAATEEEILKRLAQPLGTEVSTEKVPPQGVVPFMLVFLREPPGVEKTFLMPIEAEYLLP